MAEDVPASGGLLNPAALPNHERVRPDTRGSNQSLALACVVALGGTVSTVLSVIEGSSTLFLVGLPLGFVGYGMFWKWVAANYTRSPALWPLERARRCLAFEGDPGATRVPRD